MKSVTDRQLIDQDLVFLELLSRLKVNGNFIGPTQSKKSFQCRIRGRWRHPGTACCVEVEGGAGWSLGRLSAPAGGAQRGQSPVHTTLSGQYTCTLLYTLHSQVSTPVHSCIHYTIRSVHLYTPVHTTLSGPVHTKHLSQYTSCCRQF